MRCNSHGHFKSYARPGQRHLAFFRRLLADPLLREARLDTGFVDAFLERSAPAANPELEAVVALVAAVHAKSKKPDAPGDPAVSRWRIEGREQLFR